MFDELLKKTMKKIFKISVIILLTSFAFLSCEEKSSSEPDIAFQSQHPKLILTAQGVKDIRAQLGSIPIFDKT